MKQTINNVNSNLFKYRSTCRVCPGKLESLWNLGDYSLTGHFPRPFQSVPIAPMEVAHCTSCSLVQLNHDYEMHEFFGSNYGYRSGLNSMMIHHLGNLVKEIEQYVDLKENDLVVDIGGNDGTTLSKFSTKIKKLLIDPTANNWKDVIPDDIEIISDFFLSPNQIGSNKARLITTISMLYDLPKPTDFIENIYNSLLPDGYWLTEQSDLDSMFSINSFDTICHEHLEYYSRFVLLNIAESVGFSLVYDSVNSANGGSRRFLFQKKANVDFSNSLSLLSINEILDNQRQSFHNLRLYSQFIKDKISLLVSKGSVIHALGASTKGNTLLQLLNLSKNEIAYVAEINPNKFGCETPGSRIPIISEDDSIMMNPDYYLVLPWHFREGFQKNWARYGSAKAIYPMPFFEIL